MKSGGGAWRWCEEVIVEAVVRVGRGGGCGGDVR